MTYAYTTIARRQRNYPAGMSLTQRDRHVYCARFDQTLHEAGRILLRTCGVKPMPCGQPRGQLHHRAPAVDLLPERRATWIQHQYLAGIGQHDASAPLQQARRHLRMDPEFSYYVKQRAPPKNQDQTEK